MARIYLKPGDRVEALCTLQYGEDGDLGRPELVDSTGMRHFREDNRHDEGGEWYQVYHDFNGCLASNPNWARLYFEEDEPGY